MPRTHKLRALAAMALGATITAAMLPAHTSADESSASVVASFEGKQIRLADGWGEATACTSDGHTARCYRTEAEMDATESNPTAAPIGRNTVQSDCALPGVRLYSGSGHSGSVLQLTTQNTTINLSYHGFNNITSSYKIGPCAARFYDTTTGGTSYPGNTNAYVWASSMVSGWNNRVGSVRIS